MLVFVLDVLNILALLCTLCVVTVWVINWRNDRLAPDWKDLWWWHKGIRISRDSATMLVAWCQIAASGLLTNAAAIADALGQPQIAQVLDKYFDPKVVGYVLLTSGLITMYARGRTLVR